MIKTPAIDRAVVAVLKENAGLAYPRNPKRNNRNGNDMPLSAWMKQTRKGEPSKILAVTEGRFSGQFPPKWIMAEEVTARIAKRFQVTQVQYELLRGHVCSHYRGRPPDFACPPDFVLSLGFEHQRTTYETFDWFNGLASKFRPLPLRSIIDERITNLVLMQQLQQAVAEAPKSLEVKRPYYSAYRRSFAK